MGTKKASAAEATPAGTTAEVEPFDLTRPKQRLEPGKFFAVTQAYPDRDACVTYVYRRKPVIDTALTDGEDAPTYIDKIAGAIDLAYMQRRWGGGEYRLRFNDENRPRGQNEICNTILKISEDDAEPVLDVRQLVRDHPDNKAYVCRLEMLGKLPPIEQPPAKSNHDVTQLATEIVRTQLQRPREDSGPVQNKMLDLMAQASTKAIEIATKQVTPVDPLEQLIKLKQAIGSDTSQLEMMKLLMAQQERNFQLIVESMKAQQKTGGSLEAELAGYEKLSRLVDRVAGKNSGGGIWETIGAMLAPMAEKLITTLAGLTALASQGGAPAPAANPQGSTTKAAPAPVIPIDSPAPPQPEPGEQMIPPSLIAKAGAQILDCLQRGVTGDQFADSVVTFMGDAVYERIASLGRGGILERLKSLPDLWAQLEPAQQQLEQFITDFLGYGQEPEGGATA